jgi:hypothetical protein
MTEKEKYIKDFISKFRNKSYCELLNKKLAKVGFKADPSKMSDKQLRKQAELFYRMKGC